MKYAGSAGIDVFHPSNLKQDVLKYKKIAKELGLYTSGGSDFHGERIKPNNKLGVLNECMIEYDGLSILDLLL